jgi:hypothetical protein
MSPKSDAREAFVISLAAVDVNPPQKIESFLRFHALLH